MNGSAAGAGGGGGNSVACTGGEVLRPKRLVRLSQAQVVRSIRALLGDDVARIAVGDDILFADGATRTFPPLASPRETTVMQVTNWQDDDKMAQRASRAVLDGFAAITRCGDMPSDDCGRGFVLDFAARAYRRPLSADERQSLSTVYDETRATLGNAKEAVQFGVYAALMAPEFLYRSELGSDGRAAGTLTPSELASALSYFLTDGPPDQALLDAAAGGGLATDAGVAAQARRLLFTDATHRNFEYALASYLALPNVEWLVFDTAANPGIDGFVSQAGRQSIERETMRFLHEILWAGPVGGLLTSRRSWVDATVARLYGVAFPPSGAVLDSDGVAVIDLPSQRAGLLTQPSFLMTQPVGHSQPVIAFGQGIRRIFVCADPLPLDPPLPADMQPRVQGTARQVADARMAAPACKECHGEIDPYGIPLESFDLIGRYRTTDEQGRPIDPSTTLPPLSGGAAVADAPAMARELAKGDRFAACLTQMFLDWAMADLSTDQAKPGSCINRAIIQSAADPGAPPGAGVRFPDLMGAITTSGAFRTRAAGGTP